MAKSDSASFKGIHPRLKERLEASKAQVGLFGDPAAEDKAAENEDSVQQTEAAMSSSKAMSADPSLLADKPAKSPKPKRPTKEESQIYTVTELCQDIKDTLKHGLGTVIVQGELADFKGIHRNGHLYCGIKDDSSQIRMVMWKNALGKVPFEIKGGLEVIVTGKLDFYGGSGSLQINVERMEPVGIGALQLKFEQLKEKLQKEGLFDESRKRPIKPVNWRIGLVTGKSTAALQDMLRVFSMRFPLVEVFLFHASVQGEKAPREIVEALKRANKWSAQNPQKPLDVLIVGRGGGSYEDLFCFNDEAVARAIVASEIPVVSAVGHEIDFTIADFVADRRAATPSNAAEICSPDRQEWLRRLSDLREYFPDKIFELIQFRQEKLDHLTTRLIQSAPHKKLEHQKELLRHREELLKRSMMLRLQNLKRTLSQKAAVIDALSPLKVLERGYSLAKDTQGKALKSITQVKADDEIRVQVQDGLVQAKVLTTIKA